MTQNTLQMFAMTVGLIGLAATTTSSWATCDKSLQDSMPVSRYVIHGDEAYDQQSDLTWQRCPIGQKLQDEAGCVGVVQVMTWDQAMAQANGAWRLPSKAELETLVEKNCRGPAIYENVFPGLRLGKPWLYWTSTKYTENGLSLVWSVDFFIGDAHSYNRALASAVRLVKDRQ